jgi:hypothetical protein
MNWSVAMLLLLVWIGAWLYAAARYTASKEGDALVEAFGKLLPAFVVVTCLVAFAATPVRRSPLSVIVLWLHHASFWALFLFLVAGQYFQTEAWWKSRASAPVPIVAASYRRLWMLTEIVPAPVALMILLTGLRLIWQRAGDAPARNNEYSLSAFWLQALVIGFSLFFWDGILGYTPIVRRMWRRWDAGNSATQARPNPERIGEAAQLFIHLLSWPFVFLAGVLRWDFPTGLTAGIETMEQRLSVLPRGWPEVTTALILWLLVGGIVGTGRFCFKLVTARKS